MVKPCTEDDARWFNIGLTEEQEKNLLGEYMCVNDHCRRAVSAACHIPGVCGADLSKCLVKVSLALPIYTFLM